MSGDVVRFPADELSKALVRALVKRLCSAVPAGFSVFPSPSGRAVEISATNPPVFAASPPVHDFVVQDWSAEDAIAASVCKVLSGVQQYIEDETRSTWPGSTDARVDRTSRCRVEPSGIMLWFGDESDPVLRFESITLDELRSKA